MSQLLGMHWKKKKKKIKSAFVPQDAGPVANKTDTGWE